MERASSDEFAVELFPDGEGVQFPGDGSADELGGQPCLVAEGAGDEAVIAVSATDPLCSIADRAGGIVSRGW